MKLVEFLIQMRASTASLKVDFDQAKSMATEVASTIKASLAGIGVTLGARELVHGIREVIAYEDEIGRAARATGMTAEQMSGLAYATKQFEVPLHDLTMGLAYFDRVEGGLMRSKQGQTAMQLLGLSVRDATGHLKDAHTMLMQVADKFASLKDTTAKTAIATALFGQTYGLELIPFLDQGSKGISALEAKAKKLGVTLTEQDVDAAVRAEASMHNLEAALLGMGVVASRLVIPSLTEMMSLLSGDANAAHMFMDGVKELADELLKAGTLMTPEGILFGGGARKALDRHIADTQKDFMKTQDLLAKSLPDFTKLFNNPDVKIPDIHEESAAAKRAQSIANGFKSLRDELTGLSEGPVARGLQHFKDLGASTAQMNEARGLLNQIQAIKQAKEAHEQLIEYTQEYDRIVSRLASSISTLSKEQKDYIANIAQINLLGSQGIQITEGLALARENYRQALLKQIQTPNEAGTGDTEAQGYQFGLLDKLLSGNSGVPPETRMMKLGTLAQQLGHKMQNSFTGMIIQGQSFSNVLKNLTTLFAEFILKAVVFKELANVFGGSNGSGVSGLIGSFFSGLAGGKASGGPVTAGSLYMVGESGPELFAPGMSGSIIPNGAISGGSRGSTVNIDARGADAGVEHRVYRALQAMQKNSLGQSLVLNYEYQARGGQL